MIRLVRTPQPINSPLLKLLQRNLLRRRHIIEIQPVRVLLLLVGCVRELFFLVADDIAPLGVDALWILPDHRVRVYLRGEVYCWWRLNGIYYYRGVRL